MAAYDLGIITAYGLAVQAGYSGTKAEFAELLANLDSDATSAAASAEAAATSETNAEASATSAAASAATASAAIGIANSYDSTATYAVGDYVLYDGTLYRCTTAVTTAGDFDSTYWTATVIGDEVTELNEEMKTLIPDNLAQDATFTDNRSIRHATGATASFSYGDATGYIDISGCSTITYMRIAASATSQPTHGMAFYDSSYAYISGIASDYGYDALTTVAYTATVPDDAVYARFTVFNDYVDSFYVYDGTEYADSKIITIENEIDAVESSVSDLQVMNALGLHTVPESTGVLNVIKRCRQMTDIKWTPAVDLPRILRVQRGYPVPDTAVVEDYEGTFKAGTEYTGIPYGRAYDLGDYGYSHSYVGLDIDFETFVTAVSNEDSIVSQESTISLSDIGAVLYSAVCSALVCYALDVSYVSTSNIPNISGLTEIGLINDDGTYLDESNFQLGDVLNLTGYHTAVITDIITDSDGSITYIELSEETKQGLADKNYSDGQLGGLCRRKGWTIDEIYTIWGDYSLYRYSNISSVTYTPSAYVNVGDEFDRKPIVHMPCMPYMGEGFVYNSEYLYNTTILIAPDLGYTYLRVYKDDTEISGSPFAVTSSDTYIDVGFSETGSYTAYLCTMSDGDDYTVSYPCHWTVE